MLLLFVITDSCQGTINKLFKQFCLGVEVLNSRHPCCYKSLLSEAVREAVQGIKGAKVHDSPVGPPQDVVISNKES